MSMNYRLSVLVLVCLTSVGCFTLNPPTGIVPGVTTYDEMIEFYGSPHGTNTLTMNDEEVNLIDYFVYSSQRDVFRDVSPNKELAIYFMNNIVVGYKFTSSYTKDSTKYRVANIDNIKKGETTCDQVKEKFGTPYGAYIYPMIENKEEKAMVYWYTETKGNHFSGFTQHIKELVLPYNDKGVITEVIYTSSKKDL